LRLFAFICGILLVCLPIAFILTILLSPLWSWIEATYGIESIGHSGPSDWCFYLVYGVIAGAALIVSYLIRRSYRRA
jgi:hypothetical protein